MEPEKGGALFAARDRTTIPRLSQATCLIGATCPIWTGQHQELSGIPY